MKVCSGCQGRTVYEMMDKPPCKRCFGTGILIDEFEDIFYAEQRWEEREDATW